MNYYDDESVPLTMEDIENMKKTIAAMSKRVDMQEKLLKPKKANKGLIWEIAKRVPINGIDVSIRGGLCTAKYTRNEGLADVKNMFLYLARFIHTSTSGFKQRESKNYFDREFLNPPLIKDLSDQQLNQSAEMLTKMIGIFDEYYIKNHLTIEVTLTHEENTRIVPVENVEEGGYA